MSIINWAIGSSLDQPAGVYMAGYAALGVGYAVFMFIMRVYLTGYICVRNLTPVPQGYFPRLLEL